MPPLERETGFEPATSTLARLHSTAELFPPTLSFQSKKLQDSGWIVNKKEKDLWKSLFLVTLNSLARRSASARRLVSGS
jgi:hypothetical protein